ncbi:MAG: TolC family protein, partial [Polyangiaceae bacterium]
MRVLAQWERAVLPAFTAWLFGCATTSGGYRTLQSDVDRAGIDARRAQAKDDSVLQGAVLDREAYVRAVLDRNPSIESARQGWRAAVARVREAGAFDDPMVTLAVAPLSIASSSTRFGAIASIGQRVPWPGKLSLDESIARAEADAAHSDFEGTRRELALAAVLLYDQYFLAVRSLEINAQHIALVKTLK